MNKTALLLALILLSGAGNVFAQCGLDIYIANDQSGSVDATENAQSRDFITRLAQIRPLGNSDTMNRIAVANWSETGTFAPFNFPGAGAGYTTGMADVLAYKNAARTVAGGTDPYEALQKAYQHIGNMPVAGRNVPKVLVLMTDAAPAQVQSGIVPLASAIKAAGVSIIVMAIGDAANIPVLQGTNIASDPSLYFSAPDYSSLAANATTTVASMLANACSTASPPGFDLSIDLNSADCGTGTASYTVGNPGGAAFSGPLTTSFYNGDPSLPTSKLLATHIQTAAIPPGGSQTYAFTNPALVDQLKLWAVVNLDTTGANAVTPLPPDLTARLFLAAERNPFNNSSSEVTATGCAATTARLEVSIRPISLSCDRKVTYQVQICNTGGVTASDVRIQPMPGHSNFVLSSATGTASLTGTAAFADPGGDNATSGYDAYGLASFPCSNNGTADNCAATYQYNPSGGFIATFGGFTLTPQSPGSGIPAGATITNAMLTIRTGDTGRIFGNKVVDAGRFNAARTVAYSIEHFRTNAQINPPAGANLNTSVPSNVTTLVQELVNQPGWSAASALSFLWIGGRNTFPTSAREATNIPALSVSYTAAGIEPGKCVTYTYVYDAATVPAGTYDASVAVSTSTSNAIYMPDANFTANGNGGLNGYDGTQHTGDEVTIPAASPCTQTPQPLTTAVVINPTSSCGGPGSYVTATVTISNPNTAPTPGGITLQNLVQTLNLVGSSASFAGEPYDITSGLRLAAPNTLAPAYPAVANALKSKTGSQSLAIYELPAGTSSFKIDLIPGTNAFNLSSTISQIPTIYNAEGGTSARDATGVTITNPPVITWGCPGPVAAGSAITLSGTVAGAASLSLTSATGGAITNTGTITAPTATYMPTGEDVANGYAAFSIYAATAGGCDAGYSCTVPISGVAYDYGDAPASYDLGANTVGTAAGSTLLAGLHLGVLPPGTETTANASAAADGDGAEEDGLISTVPVFSGTTATYQVRVTNTTAATAYLSGFADFNADGNLLSSNEQAGTVTIPASSGTAIYNLVFSNVPATGITGYFMRLRLSTSSGAVAAPYGASPEGEVEDYQLNLPAPLPVRLSSFAAAVQGCSVMAGWQAEDAAELDRFVLERSADGQRYTAAGTVAATADRSSYSLADQPGNGVWYYRLRLEHAAAPTTYSHTAIAMVNCGGQGIQVYPTTTADVVQVVLPGDYEQAAVTIVNDMGYTVPAPVSGNGTKRQVRLGTLPPGLYMVLIRHGVAVHSFRVIRI